MADGGQDLSNLFTRVTALEQADVDSDQTVARIVKLYGTLGLRVTLRTNIHQYRLCGDTNPIYPATCAADTYL